MDTLRNKKGYNDKEAIEISYDIQAGSYIENVKHNERLFKEYWDELGKVIDRITSNEERVLDCGAGEMTTLCGLLEREIFRNCRVYAFDLSFSRIHTGIRYLKSKSIDGQKVFGFVADMMSLPFRKSSIEVVYTTHAIEPNRGRKREILREIFRVASEKVILFEPSYEENSKEGRERMDKLGYIRDLPEAIEKENGNLIKKIKIKNTLNELNPTYAYYIEPPNGKSCVSKGNIISCPISKSLLKKKKGCYYSEESLIAYPIIWGVPLLREEDGIIATSAV